MELGPVLGRRFPRREALRPLLLLAAAGAFVASCAARTPPEASPDSTAPAGDRAYIVFFDWNSAAIGPRGREIVAEAARAAGGPGGSGRVELQAYADRSGRADRNQRLSQRRAEAVAEELGRLGVGRGRVSIQSHGENRPFVATRDDVREGQNRAVWIVVR